MNSACLSDFLEQKPLYYKEIDHVRVHSAYALLKPQIKHPKTVHIVGTNGKGSTGRMIAHLAYLYGGGQVIHDSSLCDKSQITRPLSVGHYSSPHILKFNERIWLDGSDVSDEVLESAHQKLFDILGKEMSESLSYFEYTTLLAFVVFENCDLMVLEAGLGGEFDATNVCDKALSVITPIGIDHQAFLGDTIEEIATTKIRSIQKSVLLAPQVYKEVVEIAKKIAHDVGADLYVCPRGNRQVNPYGLQNIAKEKAWPDYLMENAKVAMKALNILEMPYEINDLKTLKLFGRFYAFAENIRIDVGHNPLAANAIVKALDKKVVLVYNSLDDKAYEEVLALLKPKVKRVEIIPIQSQRATTLEEIECALDNVGLDYSTFNNTVNEDENYLVFGSFYVVEEFLKRMNVSK